LIADQAFLLPGGIIGAGSAYKAAVDRIGYTINEHEAKSLMPARKPCD